MKNNKVEVAGIVVETKQIEKPYMLEVKLKVNRKDKGYVELLKCFIADENLMNQQIEIGDYLYSNSAFLTRLKRLRMGEFECSRCHNHRIDKRVIPEGDIVLEDFELKKGISLEESEGINKVFLIGKIQTYIPRYADHLKVLLSLKFTEEQKAFLLNYHIRKEKDNKYDYLKIQCDNSIVERVCQKVRMHRFVVVEGELKQYTFRRKRPYRCECLDALQDAVVDFSSYRVRANDIRMIRMTSNGYEDWDKKGL